MLALGVGNCRGPDTGEYGGPNQLLGGELCWPSTGLPRQCYLVSTELSGPTGSDLIPSYLNIQT